MEQNSLHRFYVPYRTKFRTLILCAEQNYLHRFYVWNKIPFIDSLHRFYVWNKILSIDSMCGKTQTVQYLCAYVIRKKKTALASEILSQDWPLLFEKMRLENLMLLAIYITDLKRTTDLG